uniref:G-protein coupled receptors family 1 profile domain-containing protein n=1 Tax=Hucho hucho TaxID=62062 RepID=A0A4W5RYT9_9TELE
PENILSRELRVATVFPREGYSVYSFLMFLLISIVSVFNNLLVTVVLTRNTHFLYIGESFLMSIQAPTAPTWGNFLVPCMVLCFLFPSVVIVYCYVSVLRTRRRVLGVGVPACTACILAMMGAFILCWLAYFCLVTLLAGLLLHIPPLLAALPTYLAKSSPVYNLVTYFLANTGNGQNFLVRGYRLGVRV